MLSYAFMQRAFLVGLIFAVILPALGLIMVLKRLSMVGDALSHISLAGVAAGLLMGINPIAGAVLVSIFAGLSIEWLRRRIAGYEELSIALIMSFGVGLAGVLSGFVPSAGSFHQYLFGSIVSITTGETVFILALSPTREMTDDERAVMQSLIDNSYARFLKVVSDCRKIPIEKLKPIADGRIYDGDQAKAIGLVDVLANREEALDMLKQEQNLEDAEVFCYTSTDNLFKQFFGALGSKSELGQIIGLPKANSSLMYIYEGAL